MKKKFITSFLTLGLITLAYLALPIADELTPREKIANRLTVQVIQKIY